MMTTVIGLGRVGTVAAAGLASAGHDVLGVDVDRQRVAQLGTGTLPLYEPGLKPSSTPPWTRARCDSCTRTR